MKTTMLHTKSIVKALALAGLVSAVSPALAADVYLRAEALTQPGIGVPMWGFALDGTSCTAVAPATCPATVPGPAITVPAGDPVLNIHLTNNLQVPVSVVIPGQAATPTPAKFIDETGRERVRSFTVETAPGGTQIYTWNGLKPGTYLYHSGTHPQLQVQMGLYGAVKQDAAAGQAYPATVGKPDTSYANEVVLLYSEIDPDLHNAVSTDNYGPGKAVTSTINYVPKYFLVNGEPVTAAGLNFTAGTVGQRTLVRFLNAGLKTHVPVLQGQHLNLVAEDGRPYPYAKEQYSVMLPALKTVDAILAPTAEGTYPLYERRLDSSMGTASGVGMLASLTVGAGTAGGAPVAANDTFAAAEDTPLNVAAPGVMTNDTGTAPLNVSLVSGVSNGTLTLNADGSFSYLPKLNYNGPDSFTYKVANGTQSSNAATVSITVNPANDAPVAAGDAYKVVTGGTLNIGAPGVLANDTDVDGNPLTAELATGIAGLTFNPNGSFSYTAPTTAGTYSFTYRANDGTLSSTPATVAITVAANKAPVAVGDMTSTPRNTAKAIAVLANDKDPDSTADPSNTIDPATVKLYGTQVTPGVYRTQRGGTVSVNATGVVTYTPALNFRGTDMFNYSVRDTLGATSNQATVRVNVL